MEARVVFLEQIADDTRGALTDLHERSNARGSDTHAQRADFQTPLILILGLADLTLTVGLGLLGVMAKDFDWLN